MFTLRMLGLVLAGCATAAHIGCSRSEPEENFKEWRNNEEGRRELQDYVADPGNSLRQPVRALEAFSEAGDKPTQVISVSGATDQVDVLLALRPALVSMVDSPVETQDRAKFLLPEFLNVLPDGKQSIHENIANGDATGQRLGEQPVRRTSLHILPGSLPLHGDPIPNVPNVPDILGNELPVELKQRYLKLLVSFCGGSPQRVVDATENELAREMLAELRTTRRVEDFDPQLLVASAGALAIVLALADARLDADVLADQFVTRTVEIGVAKGLLYPTLDIIDKSLMLGNGQIAAAVSPLVAALHPRAGDILAKRFDLPTKYEVDPASNGRTFLASFEQYLISHSATRIEAAGAAPDFGNYTRARSDNIANAMSLTAVPIPQAFMARGTTVRRSSSWIDPARNANSSGARMTKGSPRPLLSPRLMLAASAPGPAPYGGSRYEECKAGCRSDFDLQTDVTLASGVACLAMATRSPPPAKAWAGISCIVTLVPPVVGAFIVEKKCEGNCDRGAGGRSNSGVDRETGTAKKSDPPTPVKVENDRGESKIDKDRNESAERERHASHREQVELRDRQERERKDLERRHDEEAKSTRDRREEAERNQIGKESTEQAAKRRKLEEREADERKAREDRERAELTSKHEDEKKDLEKKQQQKVQESPIPPGARPEEQEKLPQHEVLRMRQEAVINRRPAHGGDSNRALRKNELVTSKMLKARMDALCRDAKRIPSELEMTSNPGRRK